MARYIEFEIIINRLRSTRRVVREYRTVTYKRSTEFNPVIKDILNRMNDLLNEMKKAFESLSLEERVSDKGKRILECMSILEEAMNELKNHSCDEFDYDELLVSADSLLESLQEILV